MAWDQWQKWFGLQQRTPHKVAGHEAADGGATTTVSTALALLESSFPNNTREQNIDLLRSESYYLYDPDSSVHGLIAIDSMTNDKTVIFALASGPRKHRRIKR